MANASVSVASQLAPEEIRAALERAVASTSLSGSPQLIRFLRFVVDETVAGRASHLKEYSIGTGALGRPVRFDPTNDSVVRVEARRLRHKLAEYFEGDGRADAVVIELPKGSYVPVFVRRELEPVAIVSAPEPPSPAVPVHTTRQRRGERWLIAGGTAIVTAAAFLLINRRPPTDQRPAAAAPVVATAAARRAEPSIVVLPFLNLTGVTDQEFVSDGLTEEITATLATVPGLRVVARTSAFTFKNAPQDVRTIGQRLGVDVVLEGSVRRAGDHTRVTAQLDRASDGVHLWASTYDVYPHDLISLQDGIARTVVDAIRAQLAMPLDATPLRRTTRDPEAYSLYLRGRYLWNRRTRESMRRSIELYEQAIARDPNYAIAYAGLAAAHATMAVNGQAPPNVAPPKAIAAARKALSLDPTLGEPHATLGLLKGFSEWDWGGADMEFQQAITLSPQSATARSWYANTLLARARFDDALATLRDAAHLDPLSMPIQYSIGETLIYARRWKDAEQQARAMLALDSTYLGAYNLLARAMLGERRYDEAGAAYLRMGDSLGLIAVLTGNGNVRAARELVARLPAAVKQMTPYSAACYYATIGEIDSAFVFLDRAYASRQTDIVSMKGDPAMDPLRDDPRFSGLLQKIGLGDGAAR